MTNIIIAYITALNDKYKTGLTTEHSFRGDLQNLLEALLTGFTIINEPKRRACGAPDYIVEKKNIPVGFIEAKDIGDKDLHGKKKTGNKEQFDRYKASLNNIIFTDYLTFIFFKDGEYVTEIAIAEHDGKQITPLSENFETLANLIKGFSLNVSTTINSPHKLAEMMANKAKMLANVIEKAITSDEENHANTSLRDQMLAFKEVLIHDIDAKQFSDIYAQTIAYGMFAARLNDKTLPTFSRQEAATLIPKTNPFLRKLFQYISGYDIDERIEWIVADLADIFRATDVAELLANFGKTTQMQDPFIHFYEDFLAEYDPSLRKARGVWYTPEPVVKFMVRAVDDILKTEFGISQGLTSNDKTTVKTRTQSFDSRYKDGVKTIEKEVHKVQILDPATGTGTFLAEVVRYIYESRFKAMQGAWSGYVDEHLIPRLNGFELLMASYAVAHLKLEMLLKETGYTPTNTQNQRLQVYLTNSLEEHHPDTGSLFSSFLAQEANEANFIKRDSPVMVVIGNPPYSGESANKGEWIMSLMEDYKKEPGGTEKLKERNPKWINDDYVKFMRYSQHYIEKNGEGVLAFINPHGFLDNPTFRGMRWHLLKTYDKIYTIDLHGNSKKKETTPDGGKDENVFDIMQGVSINLFVKTGRKKSGELAQVYHYDLYGKRKDKYDFLNTHQIADIDYVALQNKAPAYFMVQKDYEAEEAYTKGFAINELFKINSVGIVTARDGFTIHDKKSDVEETITKFLKMPDEEARTHFKLGKDVRDWKVSYAKEDLKDFPKGGQFTPISYRPFDTRWTFYTGKSKGFHCYPRNDVMNHFVMNNIGLSLCKQFKAGDSYQHIFISNQIMESSYVSNKTSEITSIFPLYIYPAITDQNNFDFDELKKLRKPNLDDEIVQQIADGLSLTFVPDHELEEAGEKDTFTPLDVLDYIYAVLHSPKYRKTYKEFLKIDFPRVPYPTDKDSFWQLVKIGGEIRQLHLLEHTDSSSFITSYPQAGDNIITRKMTKNSIGFEPNAENHDVGKVWINDSQYFDNVPKLAWEFYIGGYQPAQKWLKDRVDITLDYEDIEHYQRVITALVKTDRLMKEIDNVLCTTTQ